VRIAKYWNKLPDKIANAPSINANDPVAGGYLIARFLYLRNDT
jgi:hypothetical protein